MDAFKDEKDSTNASNDEMNELKFVARFKIISGSFFYGSLVREPAFAGWIGVSVEDSVVVPHLYT